MALPQTNREVYHRNPLAEVTAQLRFPPILRIEAEPPAQLQEAIRDRHPLYRQIMPAGQLPPNLPAPVRQLIQGMGPAAGSVQHLFETQDASSGVMLSRENLIVRTTAYSRWEEFCEQLNRVREVFEGIYRPAYYQRVALRYIDVVRRSILGLHAVPWGELLNPAIGGELTTGEFGESIDSLQRRLHCKLEGENRFLTLNTGIALAEPAEPGSVKEKCFLIDADFHTHKRTESANVTATLDSFNRSSGNLFRWAIQPRLREALDPQPLA